MKLTLDDEQIEHIVLNSAKEAAEYRNTMEAMSIVAAEQKAKWDAKREERDKVAADQKAKWDADREKWERSATEMAERIDIAVMKTSESVKQMYGWQFNQTAAFETLVTSVLGKYLLTFGSTVEVSLSSKVLRKLPIVADVFKVGVEWVVLYSAVKLEADVRLSISSKPKRISTSKASSAWQIGLDERRFL